MNFWEEYPDKVWHELACDALCVLESGRADSRRDAAALAIQIHSYTIEEQHGITNGVYRYVQEKRLTGGAYDDYREAFLDRTAVDVVLAYLGRMH